MTTVRLVDDNPLVRAALTLLISMTGDHSADEVLMELVDLTIPEMAGPRQPDGSGIRHQRCHVGSGQP